MSHALLHKTCLIPAESPPIKRVAVFSVMHMMSQSQKDLQLGHTKQLGRIHGPKKENFEKFFKKFC